MFALNKARLLRVEPEAIWFCGGTPDFRCIGHEVIKRLELERYKGEGELYFKTKNTSFFKSWFGSVTPTVSNMVQSSVPLLEKAKDIVPVYSQLVLSVLCCLQNRHELAAMPGGMFSVREPSAADIHPTG